MNRRDFLKGSAQVAGIVGLTTTRAQAQKVEKAPPSERVVVGVMGVRGRGRGLAQGFASLPNAEVAYLCDVDDSVVPPALKAVTERQEREPKVVKDFRRILDDKDVHALVIATPDHWHAVATVFACQADKDVYVEKPVSHNVREGRIMVEVARRTKRIVQAGTQSRSGAHFHSAVEFLRSGKLGRVLMAKAINSQRRANIGKKPDAPVPPGVDYDMWLGPAPKRPFNPNRFHYNWHWYWDYGTGDLGNDGVHQVDVARWGLGVTAPISVTCHGGKYFFDDDQQTPDTQIVVWDFGHCTLIFEQRLWAPYHEHGYENGNIFYCENGYMKLGADGWKVFGPRDEPGPTSSGSERDRAHLNNFVECVKTRSKPNADVEEGHYSALLCHLGNISYRLGRRLKFDPKTETFIGDAEANKLLTRTYRKPWEMPKKR